MYNENERGFSIRDVILQLLLLVLFIFVLIWLFPTKGFVNELSKKLDSMATGSDHSILYNKIFNENLIEMKESAKSYYTTSRLPKNIGDKVSMTLGEMLDKKIILPFADKNGESCSTTDSYVEVTKMDEEFQMKVNLSCSGQEDYMIIHLGCYQYCDSEICEKEEDTTVVASGGKGWGSTTTKPSEPIVTRPVTNNYITNNYVTNNNTTNNNTTNNITNNNDTTKPDPDPKPDPEPDSKKVLYYQYRTKTLVTNNVNVNMCDVRKYQTVTKDYYSLAHTVISINNIVSYPFAIKLPSNATNVKLKSYALGYNNFNFNTYISEKKGGDIYNYQYGDGATSAHTSLSDALLQRTAIKSNHGSMSVSNVRAVQKTDRVELRIDYSVYFDKNAIKNSGLLHVNDGNVGNIYYVPSKFVVTYDIAGNTVSKKCSEVTRAEEDYVYRRWSTTEKEQHYEYGPYQWTKNPNLSDVEYTGKKEYRDK